VAEVNATLASNPGIINTDPYNSGWMIRVKPTNSAELEKLLDAEEYQRRTGH
jgi:glycine cleavage system H protein